ncbi:hypothetical protein HYX70_03195 [Candidatus Saccharibacteria bacterium]|nr:hypothetical protein [Candidatus Saccharibacteria bacterium]
MKCIYCGFGSTSIVNSRRTRGGTQTWRRHKCGDCEQVFSSYEKPELSTITIMPSRGSERPYKRFILTRSILEAFEGKQDYSTDLDALIDTIEIKLISLGQSEMPSKQVAVVASECIKPVSARAYMRYVANHADSLPDMV